MPTPPLPARLEAVVVDARAEAGALVVRFAPCRGARLELEDRCPVSQGDGVERVRAVGRMLRILRAARIQAPEDPYSLLDDPERSAELLLRCRGARVVLHVVERVERVLTVWTDAGVDRIRDLGDLEETPEGLRVRRRGAASSFLIPRRSVIRFETRTVDLPEIAAIEVPTRSGLH